MSAGELLSPIVLPTAESHLARAIKAANPRTSCLCAEFDATGPPDRHVQTPDMIP